MCSLVGQRAQRIAVHAELVPAARRGHVDGAQSLVERHRRIPAHNLELKLIASVRAAELLDVLDQLAAETVWAVCGAHVQVLHVERAPVGNGVRFEVAEREARAFLWQCTAKQARTQRFGLLV